MSRSVLIDCLKVLASQLIVVHHLASYSPMADPLAAAWPRLLDFIREDGRLAVQPFLVMGGFLAARSLPVLSASQVPGLLMQRYLRLAPQLMLALLLVMAVTWLVGGHLVGATWISPLPSGWELLAHLLLLQDVLDIEALSAGVWYVAIDLQLYALLALCAWACGRRRQPLAESTASGWVALGTVLSAAVLSRNPDWDVWAPYFLSAYGLGVLAAWARLSVKARLWWWLAVTCLVLDWLIAPRERPVWALATAGLLYGGAHLRWRTPADLHARLAQRLSNLSYSVFVCHFAAIVLVSGLWMRSETSSTGAAWAAVAATGVLSLTLAVAVEGLSQTLLRKWPARRGSNSTKGIC